MIKKVTVFSFLVLAFFLSLSIGFSIIAKQNTYFTGPSVSEPGAEIEVEFTSPMSSPNDNRYWITIIEADAEDAGWGSWVYVEDGAKTATLKVPDATGKFEIRLHANYPQKPYNVVQREPLEVK